MGVKSSVLKIVKDLFNKRDLYFVFVFFMLAIACHGFVMFNHYPAYSGVLFFVFDNVNEYIAESRWLSSLLVNLDGLVTLPWLIGLEFAFLLAVTSLIIIKIYDIDNNTLRILIGLFVISSPVIYSTNAYFHSAALCALNVFFATLAVYFLYSAIEGISKYILFVLFLTFSLGIYQPYFMYAIVLIIIHELLLFVRGEGFFKIVKNLFIYFTMAFFSFVLNALINMVFQCIFGVDKLFGMGIPRSIRGMWYLVKRCYSVSFSYYLLNKSIYSNFFIKCIFIIEFVILFVIVYYMLKLYTNKFQILRFIIIVVVILLLPIPISIVHALSYRDFVCCRMWGGIIPITFMLCVFAGDYEKTYSDKKIIIKLFDKNVITIIVCVLSVFIIWYQVIKGNTMYMNMYISYEKEYSLAIRIVDKIESVPEYYPGIDVYIVGSPSDSYNRVSDTSIIDDYISGMDWIGNSIISDAKSLDLFIKQFIQTDMNIKTLSYNDLEKANIDNMNIFPADSSIKYINDSIVIKFSNEY